MARDSRITRTVNGWNVEVMVAYTDSMTIKTEVIPYTGNANEDSKILKEMQKALDADNVQLLKIVSKEETQQLYAMSESEFMRRASKVDDRTGTRGMVTKTITGWNVEVMVAYTDSMTIKTEVIPYTGNANEDSKILKEMQKALDADNVQLLKIVSKEETQQLYAMSESEFMRNAKQIANRYDAI